MAETATVIVSPLSRAVESADRLGVTTEQRQVDSLFVEVSLPLPPSWAPPLPCALVTLLLRIAWFLGIAPGEESWGEAKERAALCADRLIALAEKKGGVALVGHGILNRLIAGELRRRDWSGPRNPGARYWAMARYRPRLAPERWNIRYAEESLGMQTLRPSQMVGTDASEASPSSTPDAGEGRGRPSPNA